MRSLLPMAACLRPVAMGGALATAAEQAKTNTREPSPRVTHRDGTRAAKREAQWRGERLRRPLLAKLVRMGLPYSGKDRDAWVREPCGLVDQAVYAGVPAVAPYTCIMASRITQENRPRVFYAPERIKTAEFKEWAAEHGRPNYRLCENSVSQHHAGFPLPHGSIR